MKKLFLLGFAVVAMAATTKLVTARIAAPPAAADMITVGSGFTPLCPPICCPPQCPKSKP